MATEKDNTLYLERQIPPYPTKKTHAVFCLRRFFSSGTGSIPVTAVETEVDTSPDGGRSVAGSPG
jgi:hypothetical protein